MPILVKQADDNTTCLLLNINLLFTGLGSHNLPCEDFESSHADSVSGDRYCSI